MRYLVQFLIPALIFVCVVYALTRQRRQRPEGAAPRTGSDTAAFVTILIVSGIVALGTAWLLSGMLE